MNDEDNNMISQSQVALLRSILTELKDYRSGRNHLPGLVSALDAGIVALADCQPALAGKLRRKWRILEEINALALDQGMFHPLREDAEVAATAISAIEILVRNEACLKGSLAKEDFPRE